MKIAIMSDFHLGYEPDGRGDEAFNQIVSAFNLALEQKPDFIIAPGDLFDKDVPSQETWVQAFKVFSIPRNAEKAGVKISKHFRDGEVREITFSGIPIIAIHGTHEFRGKDFRNAVEVLESAGFVVYLHGNHAMIEKGGEKIAVHGFSGVPEKKALDVLKMLDFKPVQGAKNIIVMHQSFKELLPFDDEMVATLSIPDLPEGFDLYVNGHFHWNSELNENGRRFVIPGSTVVTQMKQLESQKQKMILVFDSETGKIEEKIIPGQRKLYYRKMKFENASVTEVMEAVRKELTQILGLHQDSLVPLIRLKLVGTLAKGFSPGDVSTEELLSDFKGKAVFSVSKDFSSISFKAKMTELSELQKSRKSVSQLGLEILEKNLEETSFNKAFDFRRIFELLEKGETEKVVEILSGKTD